jgi:hypothetical protein
MAMIHGCMGGRVTEYVSQKYDCLPGVKETKILETYKKAWENVSHNRL